MNAPTKVVAMVVARLDSSRLPAKALRLVHGQPLVQYLLERARQLPPAVPVVLATSQRPLDDPLAAWAVGQQIDVYRGDAQNVARRLLDGAGRYGADYLIRINGDSPFWDPDLVSAELDRCEKHEVDLVTNLIGRTFPYGIALEIIRVEALAHACARMQTPDEGEHVTLYFYRHLEEFKVHAVTSSEPHLSAARLVVDTEADLEQFAMAVAHFGERTATVGYAEAARLYLAFKPQS